MATLVHSLRQVTNYRKQIPNWMTTTAKFGITICLLAYLLHSVGLQTILREFATLNPPLLGIGIGIGVLAVIVSAAKWMLLLRARGNQTPFLDVLSAYYSGTFWNLFLPSMAGGDVIKAHQLSSDSDTTAHAYSSVFLERFSGLIALVLFFTAGIIYGIPADVNLIWAFLTATTVTSAVTVAFFSQRGFNLLNQFLTVLPSPIQSKLVDVFESLYGYRNHKQVVLTVVGISIGFQLLNIIQHWVLASALGIEISLAYLFLMVPIYEAILILPISINGHGVREYLFVVLLAPVGIAKGDAVSFALLSGLTMMIVAAVGAGFYLNPSR